MVKLEKINYYEAERLAILENRAAELERRLLAATAAHGLAGWVNAATPGDAAQATGAAAAGDWADGEAGGSGSAGRTEELLNRGRPGIMRKRRLRLLRHWRALAAVTIVVTATVVAVLVTAGGPGASWPASVAVVQGEARTACANPDTAAEPSGLDFACAKGTQQVLWVFSLLGSGDNPGYVDAATGRLGLEPISPAQGGEIFWSLNAHHPYDPASPTDSLMVAARAIDNIVAGATVTSASGAQQVEPGLESTTAGCQRYTGSAALVTRSGYPARCAAPLTASGTTALVSDVFAQWTGGTPSRIAAEAGTLFANADNPGNPQVQAILATLPASGG